MIFWNSGVFSMIRNLSDTVMMPIAGIILTFVTCYELIFMIIDKNNMHELDTWMIFRWIMKTFVAVMLVTNSFNIMVAIFEVAQNIVTVASGVITSTADLGIKVDDIADILETMNISQLVGLYAQAFLVSLTLQAITIVIFVVVWGRIIEIFLYCSVSPIPMSTFGNREWSGIGQNYLKALAAIGVQGFFILVCVGIYVVMVESIKTSTDISAAMWSCCGYTVLLCFALLKTGSFSKGLFNAH